ncbi:MAG: PQQ-binding-like beta-propeller repeat protein, partial [Planctomycetaceae bacterium]
RKEVPHEAGHETNSLASASVVTDGKRLYASFGSRGIYCYDLDGKKVWETDLGEMETRGSFGEGATPALHGDTLVVPWDHEGPSFVVALDAKTGDEKWRVDRDEPTTWATPLVVPRGDGFQVVLNGTNRVRSYDIETGELRWECGGQAMNPIPTPVADDERVYAMTGFRGFALYAIPLDATGDLTDTDRIAWKRDEGTPYISSPVLSQGLLYITKDRNAILSCVEAETGKEVYANERLPGLGILYSSPVAAAGRLYFFDRDGNSVVVNEGRTFEVLAENSLDETVDASPAIIGDTMYVRGEKHLYAIAEK